MIVFPSVQIYRASVRVPLKHGPVAMTADERNLLNPVARCE